MKLSRLLEPLLYSSPGKPTPLLVARMQLAKFAATRGWVVPMLTTPRKNIVSAWRNARKEDGVGYRHYIELNHLSEELLGRIKALVKPEGAILDLGCNVGRELNALWQSGYRHLTGVEIGVEPVRAMQEVFPEMALGARIFNQSMTEAVRGFEDGEFDLVYAHGSLVSLSARDQRVFDEMVRISKRLIITLENEWSLLLYPRDFGSVFTRRGLVQLEEKLLQNPDSDKKAILRVFEKKQRP